MGVEWGMMRHKNLMRTFWLWMALVLTGAAGAAAGTGPVRGPDEEANSAGLRARPGLLPNEHLLCNGWGVTPAGQHVPMSDLALKLVVAPDGKRLLAAGVLPAVEPGVSPGGGHAGLATRLGNAGAGPGGKMPPSTSGKDA